MQTKSHGGPYDHRVCVCVCVGGWVGGWCVCVLYVCVHARTKVLFCSGTMQVDPQLPTAVIAHTGVLLVVETIQGTADSSIYLRISHLSYILGLSHQIANLARDKKGGGGRKGSGDGSMLNGLNLPTGINYAVCSTSYLP